MSCQRIDHDGGALFSASMFAATTFLPLYVQAVLGGTPTQGGQLLTPMLVLWPLCSTAGGFLIIRVGFRPLVVGGLGLAALSNLVLAFFMGPQTPLWVPMVCMGLFGSGWASPPPRSCWPSRRRWAGRCAAWPPPPTCSSAPSAGPSAWA